MNLNPFSGLFKNPADSAMPYMSNIPGMIKPIYDPYMDAGKQSLATLMGQYGSLINDPNKIMNMLSSGYKQSPGYQFQMNQGMNAANNAAAAGGMIGTPSHQNQSASIASNLANQDFMNYLGSMMGLYDKGLGGMGEINKMGYGASNEYGNTLGNNQLNMANMAYLGRANQNSSNSNLFNNLLGLGGSVLGGLFGRK
jgi:hypothetical protein